MTATAALPQQSWKDVALQALGWFALVLGVVALFVPLVPAAPFLLVSAVAFAK